MLVFPSFSIFSPEKPSWWLLPSGVSLSLALPGSAVRINGSPPWLHIRNTQRAFRYYCLHLNPRTTELQSLEMEVGRITMFSKSSLMTLMYDQGKELAYALHSALNCFGLLSSSVNFSGDPTSTLPPLLPSVILFVSPGHVRFLWVILIWFASGYLHLPPPPVPKLWAQQVLVSYVWVAVDWVQSVLTNCAQICHVCLMDGWGTSAESLFVCRTRQPPGRAFIFFRYWESGIHRSKHLEPNFRNHH